MSDDDKPVLLSPEDTITVETTINSAIGAILHGLAQNPDSKLIALVVCRIVRGVFSIVGQMPEERRLSYRLLVGALHKALVQMGPDPEATRDSRHADAPTVDEHTLPPEDEAEVHSRMIIAAHATAGALTHALNGMPTFCFAPALAITTAHVFAELKARDSDWHAVRDQLLDSIRTIELLEVAPPDGSTVH